VVKIICLRGFSASGKSTRAGEIADQTGAVVVCRDDLRKMLFGSYLGRKEDEDRVTVAEEAQVSALLKADVSVVIDATHLHAPYLRKWAKVASRLGAEFDVVDVHCDIDECKRRDHARMKAGGRYVGDSVIDQQVKRFPRNRWPTVTAVKPVVIEPYESPIPWTLPVAIIVDIDGTLAHMNGRRSPYDYTRVLEDDLDDTIALLLDDWKYVHPRGEVLVVSGRDHTCRKDTLAWLNKHDVSYDHLFMRPADAKDEHGNKIPDWIVKYNLFNQYIRYDYDVQFVLDDRLQVCRMWHRLGLKILRVGDPDADF